jgi:long-chain acyl-CoA synthetase
MPSSELISRFARIRRDRADRLALIGLSEARALTNAQLWDEFDAMRTALARARLDETSLVLSVVGNRLAYVPLLMACLDSRIALMPADRGTTLSEVLALADRWHATALVLVDPPSSIEGRPHSVTPLPGGLSLVQFEGVTPAPELYAGAAVLKLTSGSTGLPKATRTREPQLLADAEHITAGMDIRPDDISLGAIPLSHAYGLGNLVLPVLTQGTAAAVREKFAPVHVPEDARATGARVFHGVPFMFEHMLAHLPPESWPDHLCRLITAGARIELQTVRGFKAAFGQKVHSFYGASEAGGICFDDTEDVGDRLTVGRPLPDVQVTLRAGEEDAPPEGGRVHVTSGAVSDGYAGLSASEQEGFIDGGFLTGDLGFFGAGGDLVLTSRVSSFINVAGRKVQPGEVERVLREMPAVADVRILGAPDARRGQMLVACIVPRTPGLKAVDVRIFCAPRLAAYKIPREYVLLEAMPRDDRGKIDRRALEDAVARHLAARAGML